MQFPTFWALNLVLFMAILVLTEASILNFTILAFFFYSFIRRVEFRPFSLLEKYIFVNVELINKYNMCVHCSSIKNNLTVLKLCVLCHTGEWFCVRSHKYWLDSSACSRCQQTVSISEWLFQWWWIGSFSTVHTETFILIWWLHVWRLLFLWKRKNINSNCQNSFNWTSFGAK